MFAEEAKRNDCPSHTNKTSEAKCPLFDYNYITDGSHNSDTNSRLARDFAISPEISRSGGLNIILYDPIVERSGGGVAGQFLP